MKILIVLILVGFVVFSSGCINPPYDPYKYAKNGTYSNPDLNLNFSYPNDWDAHKSHLQTEEGLIEILGVGKDNDLIAVYLVLGFNSTLSGLSNIFELMKEAEYVEVKTSEREEIGNRTWIKLETEYHGFYETYFLGTSCFYYNFIISGHLESNDTTPLYQIAESFQCGEVPPD